MHNVYLLSGSLRKESHRSLCLVIKQRYFHWRYVNQLQMSAHNTTQVLLRCIKDWISTVSVLTQVAYNISRKENDMGMYCDIQSHPTRPLQLPHPKSHLHVFNTFLPAKRTSRVADLQEQLFSLFFLDSSSIAFNRYLSRRMSNCTRFSRNGET